MTAGPYTIEQYDEVVDFLCSLYRADSKRPYWLPGRWEYATYLCSPLFKERGFPGWDRFIRIIRDNGSIVGLVNSENPDHNAFVHTHPDHRHLEEELIAWAEQTFETDTISVWALNGDDYRARLLKTRGYVKEDKPDYLNWVHLERFEPVVSFPKGYTIASFDEGFDLSSRIECSAKAFGSQPFSKEVYFAMQKAPNYDPALDLVVKNRGTIVSLCTIWKDLRNELGYFEPVATHPEHQRRGLGRAVLNEGMRRLKERNVKTAYVGSAGDWRRSFYRAVGFAESVLCNPWAKRLRKDE
jgi:predicted N-acetyltransferase YhbS